MSIVEVMPWVTQLDPSNRYNCKPLSIAGPRSLSV